MSRIISGKVRLDVQQTDFSAVLNESIETLRVTAEAKGVRVQAVMDPFAGPISGDPNRLRQVFWNILHNAIKFTPKGGNVQVRLEESVPRWKSMLLILVKASHPNFCLIFSIGFNKEMRRPPVGTEDSD